LAFIKQLGKIRVLVAAIKDSHESLLDLLIMELKFATRLGIPKTLISYLMNWKVYILRCADNSLYTGITTDLERRLTEHNSDNKKGARYTRARRPVDLVYHEACEDRAQASSREYQLKKLSRSEKLTLVGLPNNFWPSAL
jgi:putative endonuclease